MKYDTLNTNFGISK